MKNCIPQRKRAAMGQPVNNAYKTGGLVGASVPRKTGLPDSPLEKARRDNGIRGLKKGGRVA